MADDLNVAARLADGRPAVEHTQSYVWACRVLGYHNPELTMHDSQVRDWYNSEDGLDLRALDEDCVKLRAAANACDEALSRQRGQLTAFAATWSGPGADAALRFAQRHCQAGEAVAAAVQVAAQRCAALRNDLWQLINRKVLTATAIDDRRLAERPAWLAAAQIVTTGAGERSAAEEQIEQQVKPYVDNDIRADWLTVMRSTASAVDESLDAVTAAVTAMPAARFELPGDLVLRTARPDEPLACIAAVGAPITPAARGAAPPLEDSAPTEESIPAEPDAAVPAASLRPGPMTPPPTVPAAAFDSSPPVPPVPPVPDASLGDVGDTPAGDFGGLTGSIGGVIGQIVGGIGSLLDSLADGLADPTVTDDAPVDDELDPDDSDETDQPADEQPEGDDAKPADTEQGVEPAAPATSGESPSAPGELGTGPTPGECAPPAANAAPPAVAPALDPSAQPAEPVPAAEPSAPPADPASDGSTPCEIAADELPQAGQ